MAQEFTQVVAPASESTVLFELPVVGTFSSQTTTYISVLAWNPDPALPFVNSTYKVRHVDLGVEVTVPAFGSPAATLPGAGTVQLTAAISNGLAQIRIDHSPPVAPGDESNWSRKISHGGGAAVTYFGLIDHIQANTLAPRLSIRIGTVNPAPLQLSYGTATFGAARLRTARSSGPATKRPSCRPAANTRPEASTRPAASASRIRGCFRSSWSTRPARPDTICKFIATRPSSQPSKMRARSASS
ncbi:MAG: hypothetical protein HGA45_44315, partial [Chloroflexales bacterium]|nr:hypothetical protein [Chloroflexales bacterium]